MLNLVLSESLISFGWPIYLIVLKRYIHVLLYYICINNFCLIVEVRVDSKFIQITVLF